MSDDYGPIRYDLDFTGLDERRFAHFGEASEDWSRSGEVVVSYGWWEDMGKPRRVRMQLEAVNDDFGDPTEMQLRYALGKIAENDDLRAEVVKVLEYSEIRAMNAAELSVRLAEARGDAT